MYHVLVLDVDEPPGLFISPNRDPKWDTFATARPTEHGINKASSTVIDDPSYRPILSSIFVLGLLLFGADMIMLEMGYIQWLSSWPASRFTLNHHNSSQ